MSNAMRTPNLDKFNRVLTRIQSAAIMEDRPFDDEELLKVFAEGLEGSGYHLEESKRHSEKKLYAIYDEEGHEWTFPNTLDKILEQVRKNNVLDRVPKEVAIEKLHGALIGARDLFREIDDDVIRLVAIRDHMEAYTKLASYPSADEYEAFLQTIFLALNEVTNALQSDAGDLYEEWFTKAVHSGISLD